MPESRSFEAQAGVTPGDFRSEEAGGGGDTDPEENRIAEGIRIRLRQAVERAGGAASLSRRSGVPLSNLNKYLRGREMKAATLVRLAEAAAVRVEWLATGRGAMSPGDELQRELARAHAERSPPPPAAAPLRGLFGRINADRLAAAYLSARQALAARGHPNPDARRLMQTTVAIYDALAEAEESSESRAHPQDDPQSSPQGSPGGTTKAG